MDEVKRYDKIELGSLNYGGTGFLVYDFVAAQAGVFPYWDWETGRVVYELKHPDDLLTDDVLKQLNNLPITEDHPKELITVKNSSQFVKGMTGNESRINGNMLEGRGTIFDGTLISLMLSGAKKECSLGLLCKVVEESGVYEGKRYDRRQKDFRLNHLAMVPRARCGSECTVKLDAEENYAVQIRYDEIDQYNQRSVYKTMKIKLDGIEHDVPDVVGTRLQDLEKKNDELTKQVGQLEGKVDGKEDEITKLKQKNDELEKNQVSAEKLDAAVEERVVLVQDAAHVLGDDYEFKGKTVRQIKVDCIKKISGDEFKEDGKSDEYINARFDTICDFMNKGEYSSVGDNNLRFKGDASDNKDITDMKQKRLNMRK
ncbi:DUF2213 domain-containing protein [Anaerosolibacter sp.]|uniref:DUF2213 domain-containing protein n=1 Tax=Anaerosolibacter sp. TaxID=1872527 RepID=UPI0039EEB88D